MPRPCWNLLGFGYSRARARNYVDLPRMYFLSWMGKAGENELGKRTLSHCLHGCLSSPPCTRRTLMGHFRDKGRELVLL